MVFWSLMERGHKENICYGGLNIVLNIDFRYRKISIDNPLILLKSKFETVFRFLTRSYNVLQTFKEWIHDYIHSPVMEPGVKIICRKFSVLSTCFRNVSMISTCYISNFSIKITESNFDCEYNRKGKEIKRSQHGDNRPIKPDSIIHQRGVTKNLLVIEVKKSNNNVKGDIKKLKDLKKSDGDYRYIFGLLLIISVKKFRFNESRLVSGWIRNKLQGFGQ